MQNTSLKKIFKKTIVCILAAMMLLSAVPMVTGLAAESDSLILDLSFDGEDVAAEVGSAAVTGSIGYTDGVSGKAAVLNGAGGYINLMATDGASLLNGVEEYTTSFWVKSDSSVNKTSWWWFAAPNAATQQYMHEKYVGVLSNGSNLTYERYNSENIFRPAQPSSGGFTAGEWTHVAVTNSVNSSTVYINGNKVAEQSSIVNVADMLGNSSVAYIGRANWETGEFAYGAVDEYKVFSKILSADEISNLYTEFVPLESLIGIPNVLVDGYVLPAEVRGTEISWFSSDESVIADGKITAGAEDKDVTVTATFDGETKTFNVKVMKIGSEFVYAYTSSSPDFRRGASMHLAADVGGAVTKLNFGLGVLYASAQYNGDYYMAPRSLSNPWIFRQKDGDIGVVAQYVDTNGVDQAVGKLAYWTTDNLVTYEYKGLVNIASEAISKPQVSYNSNDDVYYITWLNGDVVREASTADWETFSSAVNGDKSRYSAEQNVSGGTVTSWFALYEEEAAYLKNKLGEIKNTSVEPLEDIAVNTGEALTADQLPKTFTANYSDTSTGEIPVEWDTEALNSIDWSVDGSHIINGQASVKDYGFPVIEDRADPAAIKYNGKYYFIATRDNGQQTVFNLRSADTLEGLGSAAEVTLFSNQGSGEFNGCFWAPELHVINGKLSVLAAISTNGGWDGVQSRIMVLEDGADPMDPSKWSAPQRVLRADGSPLISLNGNNMGISLDMTYLEDNGNHYYIWSARYTSNNAGSTGDAHLAIAKFDPADPTRLTSDPVIISSPEFGWENARAEVDEGPYILKHDGRIFMTLSGSATDSSYAVGLMEASPGIDLTNPDNWSKVSYPILASDHVAGQPGPGHNSFVQDEYGRDVLVFHSGSSGSGRDTGFRTVHYDLDGEPVLYMTPERYLKTEYRTVQQVIVVGDADAPDKGTESAILTEEDYATIASDPGGLLNGTIRAGSGQTGETSFLEDNTSWWSGQIINYSGTGNVGSNRAAFVRVTLPSNLNLAYTDSFVLRFTVNTTHNSGYSRLSLFSLNEELPTPVSSLESAGETAIAIKNSYTGKEYVASSNLISSGSTNVTVSFDLTQYVLDNPDKNVLEFEMLADAQMLTLYDSSGVLTTNNDYYPQWLLSWSEKEIDPIVDKSELQALYDENLKRDDLDEYTEESVAVFEEAMATAKEVLEDNKATEEAVANALDALQSAISGLKLKPIIQKYLIGDVNFDGDITLKDALLVQKYVVKLAELSDVQKFVADTYIDDEYNIVINLKDVLTIQKYVAGKPTNGPIGSLLPMPS